MISHFDWTATRARQACTVLDSEQLNKEHFKHLMKLVQDLCGEAQVDLRLVWSSRQSSFFASRRAGSGFFFDVGQSLLVQNMVYHISQGADYAVIAELLKQSACLYVSAYDQEYAKLLAKTAIINGHEANHYFVDDKEIEGLMHFFFSSQRLVHSIVPQTYVDLTITAHELLHYFRKIGRDDLPPANDPSYPYFDAALEQCCYQDRPDFLDLVTLNGTIALTPEAIDGIRDDLVARKSYYLRNRARLVEEIEADQMAYCTTADFFFSTYGDSAEIFTDFCSFHFLIISLFDLHQAMMQRALHSCKYGIETVKPPEIADIHLRKIALIHIMYDHYLEYHMQSHGKLPEQGLSWEWYQSWVAKLKDVVDHLYVMPVTLAFKEWSIVAEKYKPVATSDGEFTPRLDVLYGHFYKEATID